MTEPEQLPPSSKEVGELYAENPGKAWAYGVSSAIAFVVLIVCVRIAPMPGVVVWLLTAAAIFCFMITISVVIGWLRRNKAGSEPKL